jgi:UDP-N-acetylmuramoyl-tripeptide--D-alanyl-D-alanine ligase
VIDWGPEQVAHAADANLLRVGVHGSRDGPRRVVIDSRMVQEGDLFVGLRGRNVDGGEHAAQALRARAWGVLVSSDQAGAAVPEANGAAVLAHENPLAGLQALARAWRSELGAAGVKVVAITGSSGKTSTKDILAALAAKQLRTAYSLQNLNTEIGLPLAILAAPADTELLVLELAMRGPGQIAQLTEIANPDVGVIVNVGPVHLELLGSLEAIAAAKAELIAGMAPGRTIVIPAREPLLAAHLREDLQTITFGEGGEVTLAGRSDDGTVTIEHGGERIALRPSFSQSHNLLNLLAAVAALRALEITPTGEVDVDFSALRGERVGLEGGIVLINDCYNANPISMRAALTDLADSAPSRRVAVLGDMLELGQDAPAYHRQVAEHAAASGVELLVTVGPLAAGMRAGFPGELHSVDDAAQAAQLLGGLLRAGDTVLIKGSRGVGLELVAERLSSGGAYVHSGESR